MSDKKQMGLLSTKRGRYISKNNYWEAEIKFGIKGQDALTVSQAFAIERLYKNWDDWRIKLAVWIIGKTNF